MRLLSCVLEKQLYFGVSLQVGVVRDVASAEVVRAVNYGAREIPFQTHDGEQAL
jgi:hypothetical protein